MKNFDLLERENTAEACAKIGNNRQNSAASFVQFKINLKEFYSSLQKGIDGFSVFT